ncbi:TPA: SIR2 family protein [Pasteurella multocida]|nr:SIR2 family protein [Pasteurella multocida]HEH9876346.1 SIR2 family protein [Pasteurella multocida]
MQPEQKETEESIKITFLSTDIPNKAPINLSTIKDPDKLQEYKNVLQISLNKILDAENIIVLAGSGTSLTFNTSQNHPAPSMADLWDYCKEKNARVFNEIETYTNYNDFAEKWTDKQGQEHISKDIELLLSRCDTFLSLQNLSTHQLQQLKKFIKDAKLEILKQTNFTGKISDPKNWEHHNKLLRVLGKRQPKQKRLKLFTTNYDLAFETAASNTGMIVIDGFEYGRPYRFNPAWFHYDIVHKTQASDKANSYLPNVFHLYKIHGSVDWLRTEQGIQKRISDSQEGEPVIIYPSSTKYQTSYESPYLDMMSSFLEAVQKPKTAILCLGFGFNDKHINNAITMALRTNPELLLMVSTRSFFDEKGSFNKDIRELLKKAVAAGDSRITLIDCDFATFVEQLPERNKPTPEEQILQFFQKFNTGENK